MLFAPFMQENNPFALVVDPYWILVSIVQFLILYWLLRRFLWGPVTRTLDDRARRIREGLDLAETARQERERMKQEVEQLLDQALAQLRKEAASMVVFATSRILGREISPEQHRVLIERSLDEAGSELKQN